MRNGAMVGAAALAVLCGCHGGSAFDDGGARKWSGASAPGLFLSGYGPLAAAEGIAGTFADPACPVVADDGTVMTIDGGCTDVNGAEWMGSATVTRNGSDRAIVMTGYGSSTLASAGSELLVTGTMNVTAAGAAGQYDWDLDVTTTTTQVSVKAGPYVTTLTITYAGTLEGDFNAPTLWGGSGTVVREEADLPAETGDVATTAEALDYDTCDTEPMSGETTVTVRGDTMRLAYDGATACDDAVAWDVNGEPQGELSGVICAVRRVGARGAGGSAGAGALVALLALAATARRWRGRSGR
jgi:hypothetical protein